MQPGQVVCPYCNFCVKPSRCRELDLDDCIGKDEKQIMRHRKDMCTGSCARYGVDNSHRNPKVTLRADCSKDMVV